MAVKRRRISPRDEVALAERALNDKLLVADLERKYLLLQRDHDDLKKRLVNLLRPDQVDAAKTCGITPEIYALEWIDLCRDKLRTYAPAFADGKYAEDTASVKRRGF